MAHTRPPADLASEAFDQDDDDDRARILVDAIPPDQVDRAREALARCRSGALTRVDHDET